MTDSVQPGMMRSVANAAQGAASTMKTALGIGLTAKDTQLQKFTLLPDNTTMATDAGCPIADTDNSLKAGERGPILIEDFQFRDKMAHFDRERIPERVVHARGTGAHGYFQVYENLSDLTCANLFQDPSKKTPVFVRFSTVAGFRGSPDTVRDVRGFATKFYTDEGNWDLVGNNIPVFFIQDSVKFPDLVHAIKPEPHNQIPQAQTAHDSFWDFVSLTPESAHMLMWILSDRTIPRSFRTMNGFGVHTFRLYNAEGKSRFVKFHWRPVLGTHSLLWDEALKIAGNDPDFHRRDLWEAIEGGFYPEFELGFQVIEEADAAKLPFDILDSTKIIPEELVPVRYIGKMTLNRNVDEFFAETEQVALHPGNVVPGIGFTEDPLLQGRLFSYTDTQFHRLSPNFQQIPINRPVCPVHNHNRDGLMQQNINKGRVNYFPNSLGAGCPMMAAHNGYRHVPVPVSGIKTNKRSSTFSDHFSQARLFYQSMTEAEKGHILGAASFELQKVSTLPVRQRVVDLFANIDVKFATDLAENLGVNPPTATSAATTIASSGVTESLNLSVIRGGLIPPPTIKTRRIAILAANGFCSATLTHLKMAIGTAGGLPFIVAPSAKPLLPAGGGAPVVPDFTFHSSKSVMFDAVLVPPGHESVKTLTENAAAVLFVAEAFKHLKVVGAVDEAVDLLHRAALPGVKFAAAGASEVVDDLGVVTAVNYGSTVGGMVGKMAGAVGGVVEGGAAKVNVKDGEVGKGTTFVDTFVRAVAKHRVWEREPLAMKIVA
ncbi:hypothetical protein HK104_000990 [Borealophlyctis nickersoniae]|nr:hypothetical protein HK104_000990 [Borealophlyctis nickersoniae]